VATHIERALDMLPLVEEGVVDALDLGSGGGLPGLPLMLALPAIRWTLLDGSENRCRFLREAVAELLPGGPDGPDGGGRPGGRPDGPDGGGRLGGGPDGSGQARVIQARAEDAGRAGHLRASFDLVVARSFGPPAVTAECGAPFLRLGGQLIVAEPPEGQPRWPAAGLAELGLVARRRVSEHSTFQILELVAVCPDRYPRRVGVPAKRPLF
jgi:16S rRNA (guanine527-N7)-methyltransferase